MVGIVAGGGGAGGPGNCDGNPMSASLEEPTDWLEEFRVVSTETPVMEGDV